MLRSRPVFRVLDLDAEFGQRILTNSSPSRPSHSITIITPQSTVANPLSIRVSIASTEAQSGVDRQLWGAWDYSRARTRNRPFTVKHYPLRPTAPSCPKLLRQSHPSLPSTAMAGPLPCRRRLCPSRSCAFPGRQIRRWTRRHILKAYMPFERGAN